MSFRVEIVWNREFHWVSLGKEIETLEQATKFANTMLDSGDGMRVKKARVIDNHTEDVVWPKHLSTAAVHREVL